MMGDLEKVRLCAEAMGYTEIGCHFGGMPCFAKEVGVYDPLTDDAQAMALVKRFGFDIEPPGSRCAGWTVWKYAENNSHIEASNADLNRAIVDCVAALQAANRGKE